MTDSCGVDPWADVLIPYQEGVAALRAEMERLRARVAELEEENRELIVQCQMFADDLIDTIDGYGDE